MVTSNDFRHSSSIYLCVYVSIFFLTAPNYTISCNMAVDVNGVNIPCSFVDSFLVSKKWRTAKMYNIIMTQI